jgi:hypothetical protein
MARNIKKIITFGDSFTAGDELLQDTYMEDILEIVKSHSHIKVSEGGKADYSSEKEKLKFHKEISKFMLDKCGDRWTEYDRQFEFTYSSLLAKRLGVEVVNYSKGGNSNIGIYDNVVNCLETIDSSTLLLIGSSFLGRKTRNFPQSGASNWTPIQQHLWHYKTYLPFTPRPGKEAEHEKYVELDVEFGDDWYFSYLAYTTQLLALKSELTSKNIPHYFIDATGTHNHSTSNGSKHRQNFFDDGTKKQQEHIQKTIASVFLPVSLLDSAGSARKAGLKHSQLFGHFSREAHKQYANYLFDVVTRANIV